MTIQRAIAFGFLLALGCVSPAPPPAAPVTPIATPAPPAAPVATPAPPPPAPTPVVIYNPDTPWKDPRKPTASETKGVFDALFGAGKWLSSPDGCTGKGGMAPTIANVATGSFTTAGAKQTLYVVLDGECGASHAENYGTTTIAVLDGGDVVARGSTFGGSSLGAVIDVDHDGVDEFIVLLGFTGQGETIEKASLHHFVGGKLVERKAFGEVYHDDCGAAAKGGRRSFSVIRAVGDDFQLEKKAGGCP